MPNGVSLKKKGNKPITEEALGNCLIPTVGMTLLSHL